VHSITNQWVGFSLTVPQISHRNSFRLDMASPVSWLGKPSRNATAATAESGPHMEKLSQMKRHCEFEE
jgi:hypothetical protein